MLLEHHVFCADGLPYVHPFASHTVCTGPLLESFSILCRKPHAFPSSPSYQVSGPDNTTSISFSDYQVYCQRNEQWVKRLKNDLKEGACFITLNAVYLGGEKGLIEQLRNAGYRVRPVNRRFNFKQ